MKTGLVLEGGGMRGVYTVGVLDYFMQRGLTFDYIVGVSAGACNAVSYISNQPGRAYKVSTNYITDKRYLSLSNYLSTGSVFGMDFLFNQVPNVLEPFDNEAYRRSHTDFKVGVTNVVTGKPVYFGKFPGNGSPEDLCKILEASSSIPIFAPVVSFEGHQYLDGGTSDPIPVRQAQLDKCDRIVVVLTRDRNYVKKPEGFRRLYRHVLREYPNMIHCLDNRHNVYNQSTAYVRKLEKQGEIVLIAPHEPLTIDRFEKKPGKLRAAYHVGVRDAKTAFDQMLEYLQN